MSSASPCKRLLNETLETLFQSTGSPLIPLSDLTALLGCAQATQAILAQLQPLNLQLTHLLLSSPPHTPPLVPFAVGRFLCHAAHVSAAQQDLVLEVLNHAADKLLTESAQVLVLETIVAVLKDCKTAFAPPHCCGRCGCEWTLPPYQPTLGGYRGLWNRVLALGARHLSSTNAGLECRWLVAVSRVVKTLGIIEDDELAAKVSALMDDVQSNSILPRVSHLPAVVVRKWATALRAACALQRAERHHTATHFISAVAATGPPSKEWQAAQRKLLLLGLELPDSLGLVSQVFGGEVALWAELLVDDDEDFVSGMMLLTRPELESSALGSKTMITIVNGFGQALQWSDETAVEWLLANDTDFLALLTGMVSWRCRARAAERSGADEDDSLRDYDGFLTRVEARLAKAAASFPYNIQPLLRLLRSALQR